MFFKAVECGSPSARTALFDITKRAMFFAHDTAKGHESVWVFLKAVLASDRVLGYEKRRDLIKLLEGWVDNQGGSSSGEDELKEGKLERRALDWIRKRRGEYSSMQ